MKKYLKIVLISLISIQSFSQEFKENFKKDVCECFTSKSDTIILDKDYFIECFTAFAPKYQSEIDKLTDKNSSLSEFEQGRIIGRNLFLEIQNSLIHSCDSFYLFMLKSKEVSRTKMKNESTLSKIDSLSILIKDKSNIQNIWVRGKYYLAFNEYKKAEEDFKNCLKININYAQAHFFLGWTYELEENYVDALKEYKKAYELTQNKGINLMIEIVNRKIDKDD